ncbi:MAG: TMEM165/GDT1 family protein [Methylocystaceae bacterium]
MKLKPVWKLFLAAFITVFVSEMGDKTQVTTVLLAGAHPLYVWQVALGSVSALVCTSFVEVLIGANIVGRYLKPETVKLASSILFIILGVLLLLGIVGPR